MTETRRPGPSVFDLTVPDAVARIRAREPVLHAFVRTRLPEALREHERRLSENPRSPLHGVPYSLKDEWETKDMPTTGGSWRHRDRRSSDDSSVRRAFDDAGAILVGKSNLSDMGLAPEASSWIGGSTRNPRDLAHTAGGSSGGAAAAVADGMSGFDWGTDIGGSIRYPAACCGVVGLKLSSETWPLTGLFPSVPTPMQWLCSQGPIATTLPQLRAVMAAAAPRVRKNIGARPFVIREAVIVAPDAVGKWPNFAGEAYERLRPCVGRIGVSNSLPSPKEMHDIYNSVWCTHVMDLLEADPSLSFASGLSGVLSAVFLRGLFGDRRFHPATAELLLLILIGRGVVYHDKKRAVRRALAVRDAFRTLWDRGAIVVQPVCTWPAPLVGRTNYNPRLLECLVPGNLSDATGLSIPWGTFPETNLPRSAQLLGPPGSEEALLDFAEGLGRA
jgi:Asp-tRNA(Asn)/Glu-tRNA(Gln) amidotransferase A subunit family amidase